MAGVLKRDQQASRHLRLCAKPPSCRAQTDGLFVIHSATAKDIRHLSAFPGKSRKVLFEEHRRGALSAENSQFKVDRVVKSATDKAALLSELTAYDPTDLDVYVIMQVA